jgi:beta-glucanase (GH16 family)
MRWMVNGNVFHSRSLVNEFIPDGVEWVYDGPMYVILNLAVGGVFDGPPAVDTAFPADLEIDYVRVYTLPEYVSGCQIR